MFDHFPLFFEKKMARILDIQRKSNQYLNSFNERAINAIESNGDLMVNMNRRQMLSSLDANDQPLVNAKTGSARLSASYAKRTGKTTPNLFLRGDFQFAMFFTMPTIKDYIITSDNDLVKYLPVNYGKIFGVSPTNQPKAQAVNGAAIVNDFLKTVFQ